jgi:hypothetical protein
MLMWIFPDSSGWRLLVLRLLKVALRLLVLPLEALVSWFVMSCTLLYPSAVDLLNHVLQMRFSGSRFLVKVDS